MKKIKLTIGMPTYEDYWGTSTTIRALILYQDMTDCEILVVDNTTDEKGKTHQKELERYIKTTTSGHPLGKEKIPPIRYVRYTEKNGTAAIKNKVFELAEGEYVICIDSHIMFEKDAIKKLKEYFSQNPDTKDLLTGPLMYNDFGVSTHFNPVWRGEMWGTWGSDMDSFHKGEPFEIWGNGCGVMACRKDAWLQFNKHFYGFGGEEGYIHEKYRQAGHKVLCLPWLQWWHQFGNPIPKPYTISRYHKARNAYIGLKELGLDTKPVYDHFVSLEVPADKLAEHLRIEHSADTSGKNYTQLVELHRGYKIRQSEWDYMIEDPENRKDKPFSYRDSLTEKDLDKHFDQIKSIANRCDKVVEISRRAESIIPLLESHCPEIVSHTFQVEPRFKDDRVKAYKHEDFPLGVYEECDLVFLKLAHMQDVTEVLEGWSKVAKKYIIIHDAALDYIAGFGEKLKAFIDGQKEWFVYRFNNVQYGLVILSKVQEERPEIPLLAWKPNGGPGTELKEILKGMGITANPGCDCNKKALQMDMWQVEGCKRNYKVIVDWMREGADKWLAESLKDEKTGEIKKSTWTQKIKIAANTLLSDPKLAFKIGFSNPADPYPELVSESIKRAEIKQKEKEGVS